LTTAPPLVFATVGVLMTGVYFLLPRTVQFYGLA
jgi:hypothetical protein